MPAASEEPLSVEPRLTAIARRGRDLDTYIADVKAEQEALKRTVAQSRRDLERLDATIERVASVATVPEMRRVMELDAALSALESDQRTADEQLAYWGQLEKARDNVEAGESRITQLRAELARLQGQRPSRDAVISGLSELFESVLSRVKFPALRDVRVDATSYLPIVRGQHYGELSSRGAIALTVAGWHLAMLEYFTKHPGLFPGLLMLDSPLSNVGHDNADQEFRDQQIVTAFYALLSELDGRLKNCQLVVCDNRPPGTAQSMVIIQFTGDDTRGRSGLIGKDSEAASPIAEEEVSGEATDDGQGSVTSDDSGKPAEEKDR
jgi:hypothetical protein